MILALVKKIVEYMMPPEGEHHLAFKCHDLHHPKVGAHGQSYDKYYQRGNCV